MSETDRFDKDLTEAVHIWTDGLTVKWLLVVADMKGAGHQYCTEEMCRIRMDILVATYIDVLTNCDNNYWKACLRWPLFEYLHLMFLKPLIDSWEPYLAIVFLKARLDYSLPPIPFTEDKFAKKSIINSSIGRPKFSQEIQAFVKPNPVKNGSRIEIKVRDNVNNTLILSLNTEDYNLDDDTKAQIKSNGIDTLLSRKLVSSVCCDVCHNPSAKLFDSSAVGLRSSTPSATSSSVSALLNAYTQFYERLA